MRTCWDFPLKLLIWFFKSTPLSLLLLLFLPKGIEATCGPLPPAAAWPGRNWKVFMHSWHLDNSTGFPIILQGNWRVTFYAQCAALTVSMDAFLMRCWNTGLVNCCRQRPLWDLRVCTCLAITSRFSVQINSLSDISACISNLIICLQFVCAFQHGSKEWTHWLIIDYANREGRTRCNIWCVLLYIIYNMVKLFFFKNLSLSHIILVETSKRLPHEFSLPMFSRCSAFLGHLGLFFMFDIQRRLAKKTRLIYETSLCIFLQLWCAATCCLPSAWRFTENK